MNLMLYIMKQLTQLEKAFFWPDHTYPVSVLLAPCS